MSATSGLDPMTSWFSRTFDTAGEFVWGDGNRGFVSPTEPTLPKFQPIDPRWEFASSITFDEAQHLKTR